MAKPAVNTGNLKTSAETGVNAMPSFIRRHAVQTLGIAATVVGLALCLVARTSAQNGYLVDTFNTSGVVNGPQKPTIVTLSQSAYITTFATYHWNNGQGAVPGTIKLIAVSANQTPTGQSWGPYGMGTQSGQTGVADTAWVGTMGGQGLLLATGSYKIEDSDPGTWSTNAQSSYQGFVRLTGTYTSAPPSPPPAPTTAPAPPPAPTPVPPITLPPLPAPGPQPGCSAGAAPLPTFEPSQSQNLFFGAFINPCTFQTVINQCNFYGARAVVIRGDYDYSGRKAYPVILAGCVA